MVNHFPHTPSITFFLYFSCNFISYFHYFSIMHFRFVIFFFVTLHLISISVYAKDTNSLLMCIFEPFQAHSLIFTSLFSPVSIFLFLFTFAFLTSFSGSSTHFPPTHFLSLYFPYFFRLATTVTCFHRLHNRGNHKHFSPLFRGCITFYLRLFWMAEDTRQFCAPDVISFWRL